MQAFQFDSPDLAEGSSGLLWSWLWRWGSPEGPPPAFRSGSYGFRCRQGVGHDLELAQQLQVVPVRVGQPFLSEVHQPAQFLHLNLEG